MSSSYLVRTFAPLRSSQRLLYSRPVAAFHTSPFRFALSESDHDHPDREAKIDHHKHDSIEKSKTGKGEWKPELASNSEQAVKHDNHDMTMEEMQKHGEAKAKEGQQPAGSSSNTGEGTG